MEFFIASVALSSYIIRYKRKSRHSINISSRSLDLLQRAKNIVDSNHYYHSPLCCIDFHGQISTSLQFFSRTILISISRAFKAPKRQLVNMEDGGTLALDWFLVSEPGDGNDPIVVINHGLLGSSNSEYLVDIIRDLNGSGYNVCVVIMRGCGGLQFTSKTRFVWLQTIDLKYAIKKIQEIAPNSILYGLGYSLGAGILLKYLGELGNESPFRTCVCISPPWNIAKETRFDPFQRRYHFY